MTGVLVCLFIHVFSSYSASGHNFGHILLLRTMLYLCLAALIVQIQYNRTGVLSILFLYLRTIQELQYLFYLKEV